MLKVNWAEKIIMTMSRNLGQKPLRKLKWRRDKLMRHIRRHNVPVKKVSEGKLEEKSRRGRPRLDYMRQIMDDISYTSHCELKGKWRSERNRELLPTSLRAANPETV